LQSNLCELPSGPVLPLDRMRIGEAGEIARVCGGGGIVRRLTDLGLAPGVRVKLLSDAGSAGPVIIRVGDARIGIGRGMARRVLVRTNSGQLSTNG